MTTTTQAAVVREVGGGFAVEEVQVDDPRPDELLVRIVATGVCHTDLNVAGGAMPYPLPAVLGHEGAGVVEAVGADVTAFAPGNRVVVSYASCGQCPRCRQGRPGYCRHFRDLNLRGGARLDGSPTLGQGDQVVHGHFFGQSSMAGYAVVPARSAVLVPDAVPLEVVGPLACGIQTGAGGILNVLKPSPGSSVVIYGAGAVGLSAVMAARLTGATTIVAVDRVPARLALATELGATAVIDASTDDVDDAVRDLTRGEGSDYALDSTGNLDVIHRAIELLAANGTCCIIGAAPFGAEFGVNVLDLIDGGRRIVGTVMGDSDPATFIPTLLDLHLAGRFPFDRLISTFGFDAIDDAVASAESGEAVKPVLVLPT